MSKARPSGEGLMCFAEMANINGVLLRDLWGNVNEIKELSSFNEEEYE